MIENDYRCFVCDCELMAESSVTQEQRFKKRYAHKEHIIPNAIGGRLKTTKLLCAKCGGEFGEVIDNALVKHCLNFSSLLNISRDRGNNQDIIATKKNGESIILSPKGAIKPKITGKPIVKLKENGFPEDIIAKSPEELKMIKGIFKKKYPDFQYTVTSFDLFEKEVLKIPYVFSKDSYRGICKIAVEFYLENGGVKEEIIHLLPYLKCSADDYQRPVHLYYPSTEINLSNKPYHLIHIKGIKKNKILFAYISLFGVSNHFVALNWGNYEGEDLEYNYIFNLIDSKEESCEKIDFNYYEVNDFLSEVEIDFKNKKEYLYRNDMIIKFNNELKKFESFVESIRDDIRFKDIEV